MDEQHNITGNSKSPQELDYSRVGERHSPWRTMRVVGITACVVHFLFFFFIMILFNPHIGLFNWPYSSSLASVFSIFFEVLYFPLFFLAEKRMIDSCFAGLLVLAVFSLLVGLLVGLFAAGMVQWWCNRVRRHE